MPNHKGMLTRLKIVGPSWNRQFKIKQAGIERRRRNHGKRNLRNKKEFTLVHKADLRRVKRMIPYYKDSTFKKNH